MNAHAHPQVTAVGEPINAGETVGDFIAALRRLGLRDHMLLSSIEYGIAQFGSGRLVAEVGPDGIEVREL